MSARQVAVVGGGAGGVELALAVHTALQTKSASERPADHYPVHAGYALSDAMTHVDGCGRTVCSHVDSNTDAAQCHCHCSLHVLFSRLANSSSCHACAIPFI